ncbi:MAG: RNA-guided endonuclease InsQ/TnpB family protein [Aggregatilineales bacterium]
MTDHLHDAYKRFFKQTAGLPRFKTVKKYKSFTLKETAGWTVHPDKKEVRPKASGKGYHRGIGVVTIQKRVYKFIKHRPLTGTIKTVTIKRDTMGRLWICFSVIEDIKIPKVSTSRIGGFDFGLTVFLKDHAGADYHHPEFLKSNLPRIRALNRSLARKKKGSRNRRKTRHLLARAHHRIEDKRRDFHYKQAHQLCKQYDVLVFEDLNIDGMKRLWGHKVSDLAFSQFIEIMKWVALKEGKTVIVIDRFEATTQTCSNCGHKQKLNLSERVYDCPHCDLILDRDHNASINIQRIGASMHTARDV